MKSLAKSAVRKASSTLLQDVVFRQPRGDSFDLLDIAFFSDSFVLSHQQIGVVITGEPVSG
jgi:hypothetical protein